MTAIEMYNFYTSPQKGWSIEIVMKEYAREAIKADRKNVVNHVKLEFTPYDEESWKQQTIKREDILEFYNPEEEDENFAYSELRERDGFEINIDKDSIINCPNILLL